METRWTRKLRVLTLTLMLAACGKKQSPATSSVAGVPPTATPVPAAPPASIQESLNFTAEVVAHQEFQKEFAPKMMFRLEPYAGNDSGWSIRIAPVSNSGGPAVDCIGAVETPLHGDTKIEIEAPETGQSQSAAWRHREFEYVAAASDCQIAWDLMNTQNYGSRFSEQEREQAGARLGQIPTRHGKFTILDAELGPVTPQNQHGTLERLKFEVDLSDDSTKSRAGAAVAVTANSPIRSVDLKPFIESHLGHLNPDLGDLETDCDEGQKPLKSLAPVLYGDLDGDGQEEAAVEGWSCLSGNGGADFRGVLKLMPDGKLAVLPIETMPRTFKGRSPYAGLRGHMAVAIRDGRLNEVYGIYKGTEANCCPEGGERRIIYRWDGQRFVLDDIIDVPASTGGN